MTSIHLCAIFHQLNNNDTNLDFDWVSIGFTHTHTHVWLGEQVINLLMAIQENSPVFVQSSIEKILDILRNQSELYSTSSTGLPASGNTPTSVKPDDQVTTDLFTGLITVSHCLTPIDW